MKYLLLLLSLPAFATDTINAGHPRLWLTTAMVSNIHTRVTTNDSVWQAFKTYADGIYGASHGTIGSDPSILTVQAAMYVALHNIPGDVTDGAAYDAHTSAQWATVAVGNYMWLTGVIEANCPSGTFAGCLGATPPFNPQGAGGPYLVGEWLALPYDWVQYGTDQFTANGADKQKANNVLQAIATGASKGDSGDTMSVACPQSIIGPNDNECLSIDLTIGQLAVASYGDGLNPCDDKDRNGSTAVGTNCQFDWFMNDSTYGLRNFFIPYYSTGLGVGSVQAEGATYGQGDFHYLVEMFVSVDSSSNVNLTGSLPHVLPDLIDWDFHATAPADLLNCKQTPCSSSSYWMVFGADAPAYSQSNEHVAGLLEAGYWLGATADGNHARQYLNTLPSLGGAIGGGDWIFDELLFRNYPTSATAAFTTPTNFFSNARCSNPLTNSCGMQWVTSRSGWNSATASWLTFRFQATEGRHNHEDAGMLAFYRKGHWLLSDVPYYGTGVGLLNLVNNAGYGWHSVLNKQGVNDHNGSAVFTFKGSFAGGGAPTAPGFVTAYENPASDLYTYVAGTVTDQYTTSIVPTTYGPNDETTFLHRSFVHIKPDYIVALDKGTWTVNTYLKQSWMLATRNAGDTATAVPSIASTVVTSLNVNQNLYITSLYPASATLGIVAINDVDGTVFGDTDQFLEPYEAWRAPSGGMDCYSDTPYACADPSLYISHYRAEITTPTQTTGQFMLTGIQGADSGGSPTVMTGLTNGNYSGVHIEDATLNWVVGGSNIPAGTALTLPISYTYTRTTTIANHLVVDVPASTAVKISISAGTVSICLASAGGCTGTAFNTTANGTLPFQDNNGTPQDIPVGCSITTGGFPAGTVGQAYSQTATSANCTASLTWSVASGSLPAGTSLNTSTGVISGTLTTAANSTFTLSYDTATSGSLSILVNAAPAITTTTLPAGTVGAAYSQTLATSGGTAPLVCAIQSGSLPTGLSISTGCVISGTPSAAATFSFVAKVTDANAIVGTKSLSITIIGAAGSSFGGRMTTGGRITH